MKKVIAMVLAVLLMLSVLPTGVFSITASAASSGKTGDCDWILENNILTISGNGAMADYEYNAYAPWYSSRSSINKIVIEPGVTYIGDYAFYYCYATELIIGDDVTETGTYAFNLCNKLTTVYLGASVTSIGYGSFFNCSKLADVYYSGTAAQWAKIKISADNTTFKNATLHYTSLDNTDSVVIDSSRYIESKHPYSCNLDETKTFTSPGAQSLTITFGEKSRLGSYGDYIYLYDGSGVELAKYTWTSALANTSLTIQGNTFSIRLATDNSGDSSTDYGYHFSSIVAHNVNISDFDIEVKKEPNKKIYEVGDTLSTTGLVLSLIHFDGSATEITSGFTTSGFNSQTIGTKTVTVNYNGKTTTFDISVKTLLGKGTCGDNATWTLDDEGCLTISGNGAMKDYDYSSTRLAPWNSLRGSITTIKISESITYIGNYAFYQCHKPTSISIPYGVEYIGDGAFSSCSSATYISLPASIKSIGYKAFEECTSLRSITIPSGVTEIDYYTFSKCSQLTYISLPNTVTSIGNYAFSDCSKIASINIPNSVTTIGKNAFSNCSKLTTINIPAGVTSINSYAFYYCTSLSSITLPEGLTTIGESAFFDCSGLKEITIPESVTKIGSSAFLGCILDRVNISNLANWCNISFVGIGSNPLSSGNSLYLNGKLITELVIPDGITKINDYAFFKCNGLKSVTIPDSVTSIGYETFYNCKLLETINIGKGVTTIGYGAFRYCIATEIVIPNSVTNIGAHAFGSSRQLKKVTLGRNVESIENYAFNDCSVLTDIYYLGTESDRQEISISSYNTPLTNATWHYDSCVGLEEHTYSATCDDTCNLCGKMRDVNHQYDDLYDKKCNICNALREKPTGTTGDCTWTLDGTDLTISGNGAMENYSSTGPWGKGIRTVTIEEGVTSIGTNAFEECFDLYEVNIASSVTTIGDNAFLCCTSLPYVAIPNGVVTIGSYAFQMCDLLAVYIPASVTSIGARAFSYCWNLEKFNIHADNTVYSSDDFGMLFDKNKTMLLQAPYAFIGEYTVPNSVTTICGYAFYSCEELTKITIPATVTYIGEWAFEGCDQLTEITLPATIAHIDNFAFYSCDNLAVVYYLGSETMQAEITFGRNNDDLLNASWNYNSCIGTTVHDFEWIVDGENNCGIDGAKHEKCLICNFIRNEGTIIPATGNHTYDDFCDDTCNICGLTRTAPHSYIWVIDQHSTCGDEGIQHEECSVCNAKRNENTPVAATGNHNYNWVVDQDPTCGGEGVQHEECSVCHIKRNEGTAIEPTGNHSYDNACDNYCNGCDYVRTAPHLYDNTCDAYCNECDHIRTPGVHEAIRYSDTLISTKNSTSYPFNFSNGIYSSTNKTDSSSSTFTITALYDCTLKIEYYTSTETKYDKLLIKHNSLEKVTASGSTSWATISIDLVAGDVVEITYSKDHSQSSGNDTIYFKIQSSETVPADTLEPACKDPVICNICGEVVKPAKGHKYSGEFDTSCDVCGEIRAIEGQFPIIYHLDGGTNALKNPDIYTFEDTIVLNDASKEGYDFVGWYLDAAKTQSINTIVNLAGELHLYAKYSPKTYEATFNFDGGICSNSITVILNDTLGTTKQYTVQSGSNFSPYQKWVPTRSGYVFAGWEYNGTLITNAITTKDNVELKALWKSKKSGYAILGAGGTSRIFRSGLFFHDSIGNNLGYDYSCAQRETYTHVYVYVSGEYKNITYSGQSFLHDTGSNYTYGGFSIRNVTTNQTLVYADGFNDNYDSWSNSYHNKKNYNGTLEVEPGTLLVITAYGVSRDPNKEYDKTPLGTISLFTGEHRDPVNISYSGEKIISQTYDSVIKTPSISKNGYEFANWRDENNVPMGNNWHYSENKTFYAQWRPIAYTISYELNGGVNSYSNPSSYTIESNFRLESPQKRGYTFSGWYSDSNFTTRVTEISNRTGNIKLYAKFVINTYTLTLEGNGGVLGPKVTFVSDGEVIRSEYLTNSDTITAYRPNKKEGYLFAGWYTNASLTSLFKFSATISDDTTLYARWISCNEEILNIETTKMFSVNVQGKTGQLYAFVPLADTEICVTSKSGNLDLCGTLYDSNMNVLVSSNDISDNDLNFMYTYQVEAGKLYYIEIKGETVSTVGDVDISIDLTGNCSITGTSYLNKIYSVTYGNTFKLPDAIRKGYVFLGWFDENGTKVTSGTWDFITNKTLYARLNTVHTVVFKDENGETLSSETYYYGDEIVAPELPTKAADNTYTYTSQWDNDYTGICVGDFVYTVTYIPTYIDYTVVFKDWEGTVLSTNTYHYGDVVTAPSAPTKAADNTYTYTFKGWDKPVVNCAGDATYTATYSPSYIDYTVIFKNGDGSVISSKTYHYGDVVTAPSAPTKAADNTYTYTFKGWDKPVVNCAGDATYTATYSPSYIDYTVVFKDWEGTVLSTNTYHYGDVVTAPSAPTKAADNTYIYTFIGWDSNVVDCIGNAVYTAVFSPIYIDYTIIFKNWDGSILSTDTYHWGDEVIAPANPVKEPDNGGVYTFAGWDNAVVDCAGNATYTATYALDYTPGDIDGVAGVTDADAEWLLMHTFFAEEYPVNQDCDFDGNGKVNDADAEYLLMHTFFPDDYPLH